MTDRQILRLIGTNAKAARLKAGLTQECVAELIGVHWQTISNIETGKIPCSLLTFTKLTKAIQTSANTLLDGVPELEAVKAARIRKATARKRKPKSRE